ncbi:MAG: hypothetical protein KF724_11125 [Phycisphaeraceae bacterium]|nr:hypothetical protein [Phycisphaeraceae bacterium]
MSSSESVSREELLDLAWLEAIGVLDEVDCDRMNRLFHAASTALQNEVRAVQASVVAELARHEEEEPAVNLRGTAITRVRDAMTAEQAALAPIASIGPRRGGASPDPDQAIEIVRLRAECESTRSDVSRWSRAAVIWRAASIVVGALLLVSLYYNLASNYYAVRIGQLALDANARDALIRELGPGYRDFVDAATMVRGLAATQRGFSGAATVYVNSRSNQSLVVVFGLREEARYTVRLVSDDGRAVNVGTIVPSGPVALLRVDGVDGMQLAFSRWEIVDSAGEVVLRT